MRVDGRDPVLMALAELAAPAPSAARDARVRARCRAALAAAPRRRPVPRTRMQRAVDTGLAVAAGLYGTMTVVEAVRMAAGVLP